MARVKKVTVLRHSKPFIILHWLIVVEMAMLLLTGFSLSEGFNPVPIPLGTARSLHIVTGLLWLATIVFFLYYFVMSREYRWFGISRISYALDFFVEEIRTFLRGEKGHNPVRYDPQTGEYVEKIFPTEVLAWWGWFLLWVGIGLSGLVLLFPENFGLVARFLHFVIADYGEATASARAFHFLVAILVIVLAAIHAYAALVFGVWKSIFIGTREEPVVERS